MGKKSDLLNKMLSTTGEEKKDFDLSRTESDFEETRFNESKFNSFSLDNETEDMDEDVDNEPAPSQFMGNQFFFGNTEETEPEPIPEMPSTPIVEESKDEHFMENAFTEGNIFTQTEVQEEDIEPIPTPITEPEPILEPKVEKPKEKVVEKVSKTVEKPIDNKQTIREKEQNMFGMSELELQILRKIINQTTPNFEGLDFLSEEDLNRIWESHKQSV